MYLCTATKFCQSSFRTWAHNISVNERWRLCRTYVVCAQCFRRHRWPRAFICSLPFGRLPFDYSLQCFLIFLVVLLIATTTATATAAIITIDFDFYLNVNCDHMHCVHHTAIESVGSHTNEYAQQKKSYKRKEEWSRRVAAICECMCCVVWTWGTTTIERYDVCSRTIE